MMQQTAQETIPPTGQKKEWQIAVLGGDGIGPEVTAEAVKVLEAVGERFGLIFHFEYLTVGGAAIDATGWPISDETLARCQAADAVLLGAVGGPKWDRLDPARRPEKALFALRKGLGLYANLRPVKVLPALVGVSTLKPEVVQGVDLLIVRELTGGIYFGEPRLREPWPQSPGAERAVDTLVYTTPEVDRILRQAFTLAMTRRKKVVSVDKANVLASSQLWRDRAEAVAREFPEVELVHMLVDNAALQLVRHPRQFDVLVTENLFGDILSDEAAVLAGSLGMLPSASLGGRVALYEPCHGSAPDIAGQGKANPLASILSAAMLLRYTVGLEAAAAAVEEAVEAVLAEGWRTADIASPGCRLVGTREMGDLVARQVLDGSGRTT